MAKRNTRLYVGLAVAFVIAILVGPTLLGITLEDRIVTKNITLSGKITIYYIDSLGMPETIGQGQTVTIGASVDWYQFVWVYTVNSGNTIVLPENGVVSLVIGGTVYGQMSVQQMDKKDLLGVRSYAASIGVGSIPQGTHNAVFTFEAETILQNTDGTFIQYNWVGSSVGFKIVKTVVADPLPAVVNAATADLTVDPFTTTSITWNYMYGGAHDIEIINSRQGSADEILQSRSQNGAIYTMTPFVYDFYARFSGYNSLRMVLTPRDGSNNIPASETVTVYVNLGGEMEEFPPTVERCDIYVSAYLVDQSVQQEFSWNLFQEFASSTLTSTSIDGNLFIDVVINPSDSLTKVKVEIDDGSPTYLATQEGASWKVTINTDNLEDGIHTVKVYGTDRTNGYEYLMGSFNISVRVQGPNPFLLTGLFIAGVVVVIVFIFSRRKK